MKNSLPFKKLLLFLLLLTAAGTGFAQTVVKGTIINQATNQPMPFVSVFFKGGKGVSSKDDGSFVLTTVNPKLNEIEFSYAGYQKLSRKITPGTENNISVQMQQQIAEEVVVKSKRGKYSNKNNPAVDLIRKVIENRDANRISAYDYVQYQQYEKLQLSLTNKPERLMKNKLLKNYVFILDNQDTSKVEGKALVPVYLEEKLSDKYFRKHPSKEQTIIKGEKRVNFGEYIDNAGVSAFVNRLYNDFNIYDNNITILTNQFLSPVANSSPTFYRFYIRDTVEENGEKLIRLNFTPRNTADLLFRGTLYVTLDGNYAVERVNMTISKNANLNWTRELHIKQEFEKAEDGRYHLSMSNMLAEFVITKDSKGSLMGERTVSFKNYVINQPAPDSIYKIKELDAGEAPPSLSDSAWVVSRHQPLSAVESKVYSNIDSLQNMRSYRRFMDIATLVLAGYKNFGDYEVGPLNAFYSFNPVEGFRLRTGGRTTPKFSKRVYLENYVAYGFKDQKYKYFLSTAYSLNKKSIYTFPMNYVKLSYQHDTKIPGQELQFVQEDNFLLSFKRGANDKFLYNDIFKAELVKEFGKNISYTFGLKYWKQSPAGAITFDNKTDGLHQTLESITTSEVSAELRWAPHEQFYQGKVYRIPIFNQYPIFKLRYIAGIKGLFNGEYNYHNVNLSVFKRFYFSQFGYADVAAEGGYIFGKLPYPLLTIHRANQTYAYQLNSFNLMNALEFISDHYASVNMDYYFNGFILNKIPLAKKLKLREVMSAKVLYGGVRDENNPNIDQSVMLFPRSSVNGSPTTFSLNGKPYVEVSVGLNNIFKLVRVDLVKRLTYLDNPDISKWGIRARVRFDF